MSLPLSLVLNVVLTMAPLANGWVNAPTPSTPHPQVSGHATSTTSSGKIMLFGGLLPDRTATNDLWEYSSDTWTKCNTEGGGPGPRMYSASVCLDDTLYVFGGWDPEEKGSGGTFKDEVWALDTETLRWTACDPMPCGAVSRHAACVVQRKGGGEPMAIVHTFRDGPDDVLVLHFDGDNNKKRPVLKAQMTTGEKPLGLSMCSISSCSSGQMIVFGGSTKTQQMSSDVYSLDTETWEWTKLTSRGDVPGPRASCAMAPIHDYTKASVHFGGKTEFENALLVFGGAGIAKEGYEGGAGLIGLDETYLLRIDGKFADWTKLEGDIRPRARVAATLDELPNEGGLMLTGGWDPKTAETFEEPWRIDL